MKKKILFIFLLLIPFAVKANSIDIKCPKSIKVGETVECVITGKSDQDVTAISATIKLSDHLSVVAFDLDKFWQGDDISDGKIDSFTKSGDAAKGDFNIGTLKIKAKKYNNGSVGLINAYFANDNNSYNVENVNTTMTVIKNSHNIFVYLIILAVILVLAGMAIYYRKKKKK